jgi:hypothetical protein
MVSTFVSYSLIVDDLAGSLERIAREPLVARESAYFLANFAGIGSLDDFLGDHRLVSYALAAYELDEFAYDTDVVRRLLSENTADADSLANRYSDSRYRDFAAAFDFARPGGIAMAARAGTVEKYVRRCLEDEAGAQNEGTRLALYFERRAPGIDNAFQVLADPGLLTVIRTALGLSSSPTTADIDRQAATLESHVAFADFKDRVKLRAFIRRFAALWDLAHPPDTTASTQIEAGRTTQTWLDAGVLSTLQDLKLGTG